MEDRNFESQLEYLSSHFPPNIQKRISRCTGEVDSLRKNLIREERTISLLPLLSSPSYPHGIIPKKSEIVNYIMVPTILQPKDVSPSFVQHASFFASFIYTQPELFARIVCKRYGQQDFHFMVYSVVPAFFGFFSSYEHISSATPFYQHVIQFAPPHVAAEVLQPFFCSLGTFRFIESVMGPFCQIFGGEIKFDDHKKRNEKLFQEYAVNLIKAISNNLNLLPEVFILMFNTMIHKNWPLKSLIDMFFTHFFTQQALVWIASSPFSHRVHLFQEVLKRALNNVIMIRDMMTGFLTLRTLFEVPSLYKAFDEDYIQVLISVSDIMCAAMCYETENELPYSLRDINYDAFPIEKRFSPFFIKVFYKQKLGITSLTEKLIFDISEPIPSDENINYDRIYRRIEADMKCVNVYGALMDDFRSAHPKYKSELTQSKKFLDYCRNKSLKIITNCCDSFESYLGYKVFQNVALDWNELAVKRQVALMTPMALNAAKTAASYYKKKIGKAFSKASHNFESKELKKLQFYAIVIPTMTEEIEKNSKSFKELEALWDKLLKKRRDTMDPDLLGSLNRVSRYIFFECVEEVTSLAMITPSRQFDLLMSIIRKMYKIARFPDKTVKLIIALSGNLKIPAIVMLSNAYIVSSSAFAAIFDDESKELWSRFLTAVKEMVNGTKAKEVCNDIMKELNGVDELMDQPDSDSSSSCFSLTRMSDLYKLSNTE